jgi:hypothetical protein
MANLNIVDVGKIGKNYGWDIGQNPAFGKVGTHAPGSYHYSNKAIDITAPQGQDILPAYQGGKPIPWQQRTNELSWRAKQLGGFTEVLGPGDPGHNTHVHLALNNAQQYTPQQLEWMFTGRTKNAQGQLTDVMPSAYETQGATGSPTYDQSQQRTNDILEAFMKGTQYASAQQQPVEQKTPQDFLRAQLLSGLLSGGTNMLQGVTDATGLPDEYTKAIWG